MIFLEILRPSFF